MTPERFDAELNSRMGEPYGLEYRVRESPNGQYYLIEQKLGRRGVFEVPLSEGDERYLRVRDGYGLVLRTLRYPHFTCPSCHLTMPDVPMMAFGERRCQYCYAHGENNIHFLGYFPLCDALLDHLEFSHPKRADVYHREIKAANDADLKASERKAHLALEGVLTDDWRQIQRVPRAYLSDHRAW